MLMVCGAKSTHGKEDTQTHSHDRLFFRHGQFFFSRVDEGAEFLVVVLLSIKGPCMTHQVHWVSFRTFIDEAVLAGRCVVAVASLLELEHVSLLRKRQIPIKIQNLGRRKQSSLAPSGAFLC
jgi:hypothetical protein